MMPHPSSVFFFFFNDTATTEIYTLSLHDALPISILDCAQRRDRLLTITRHHVECDLRVENLLWQLLKGKDRKSTRLNSSHDQISYAVFCLKKKKQRIPTCILGRRDTPQLIHFPRV